MWVTKGGRKFSCRVVPERLNTSERQFLAGVLLDRDNEQQDGKGLGKESSSLTRRPGFTMFQVERFNTHNTTSVNTYTHTD